MNLSPLSPIFFFQNTSIATEECQMNSTHAIFRSFFVLVARGESGEHQSMAFTLEFYFLLSRMPVRSELQMATIPAKVRAASRVAAQLTDEHSHFALMSKKWTAGKMRGGNEA